MRNHFLLLFFLCLLLSFGALADTGTEICMERFMQNANADGTPRILYTGVTKIALSMRSQADKDSDALGALKEGETVQIFGFDQEWLFCWRGDVGVYFVGRHNVDNITPVSDGIAPYGVIRNNYVAVTATDTVLYASPDTDSEQLVSLSADSRLSIWQIENGWAVVPYKRVIGYLYVGDIKQLEPVAPNPDYAQAGDIISVFTTFYSLRTTELNLGRMENIRVGCNYINGTYDAGYVFDFDAIAGPYRKSRGYKDSPVLINGEAVAGSGGGTCQVSTTLYNALLQIPEGISIIYRHAHGPSGATYAPHGVDAAVGRSNTPGTIKLNLEFQNTFDFPITIDCTVQSGALCIAIRKGAN